jgi:hypothetical protein
VQTTINYTDVGRVCAALAMQAPETLSAPVTAGATSIQVTPAVPADWQVGSTLVLDSANPTLRETVTITGPPSGQNVPVTATANGHVLGAPVVNATIVAPYPGIASRAWDRWTYNKAGFGYEAWTDTKEGNITNHGTIVVALSKPLVVLSDVTSATFQPSPAAPAATVNLAHAWIKDDFILEAMAPGSFFSRQGMAVVTYSGGYNPIPDDIANAATVIAARMYKERDSGYADVIGNADTGILEYKKAIPSDVLALVQAYRRWVP